MHVFGIHVEKEYELIGSQTEIGLKDIWENMHQINIDLLCVWCKKRVHIMFWTEPLKKKSKKKKLKKYIKPKNYVQLL